MVGLDIEVLVTQELLDKANKLSFFKVDRTILLSSIVEMVEEINKENKREVIIINNRFEIAFVINISVVDSKIFYTFINVIPIGNVFIKKGLNVITADKVFEY